MCFNFRRIHMDEYGQMTSGLWVEPGFSVSGLDHQTQIIGKSYNLNSMWNMMNRFKINFGWSFRVFENQFFLSSSILKSSWRSACDGIKNGFSTWSITFYNAHRTCKLNLQGPNVPQCKKTDAKCSNFHPPATESTHCTLRETLTSKTQARRPQPFTQRSRNECQLLPLENKAHLIKSCQL